MQPSHHPFHPAPEPPAYRLPALSCDSQFHVFGPTDRYPPRPDAAYQMPMATIERALALHNLLGIERGVIVQPTTYGADHSALLDGLAVAGGNYRGCANAITLRDSAEEYWKRLDQAGVRGVRFSRAGLGGALSGEEIDAALDKAAALGWYVKVQPDPEGVAGQLSSFRDFPGPVLVDHMGRPDPRRGDDDPSLRALLALLGRDNWWVMLSLGEKISHEGEPWNDIVPLARHLIAAAPDRCIWGSDWPHPLSRTPPPHEGALLDLLARFAPDLTVLRRILVDNPARLFGFPQ